MDIQNASGVHLNFFVHKIKIAEKSKLDDVFAKLQ